MYYPTLSLVSKRFQSILASTELYETRKLLGSTESCLYVVLSNLSSNSVGLLSAGNQLKSLTLITQDGPLLVLIHLESLERDHDVYLLNCGGNLVVLWAENVRSVNSSKKMIWCAQIAIERRNKQEIPGKVLWCDVVLTVPKSCQLEQVLVATI